jgi:transposase
MFANSVHIIILMGMNRGDLTNTPWERLQPLLPPQKPKTGRPAVDHRRILNGILWILRTGAPWRDLPERYGPWRTVASRFYRWQKAGLWSRLLAAVQAQVDADGQFNWDIHSIDGTISRAHQHAAGAKKGTQKPKPEAGAGAVSAPQFTCGRKGATN